MLIIWGRANSNNVKKVLWCAEELRLEYQRLDAGGQYGVVDTAAFGAMNPNRRVPVLQDDGLTLWESNAIVRYLAARYGVGKNFDANPADLALADRWMDWASITFGPPFVTVFRNLMLASTDKRDMNALALATKEAADVLRIVDAALQQSPFLSGPQFGMGDIPLGCLIHSWFQLEIVRPQYADIIRWYDSLLKRPAYRKVVAIAVS